MDINKHKKKCQDCLGCSYDFVHLWLDEFADGSYSHRQHRHHEEGIEEVRAKWGTKAAIAARLHIEQDWGYVPRKSEYENIQKIIYSYYQHKQFYIPK